MSYQYSKVELHPHGGKLIAQARTGYITHMWQGKIGWDSIAFDCPQEMDFTDFTMQIFNDLGGQGWELAGIQAVNDRLVDICWFKREMFP